MINLYSLFGKRVIDLIIALFLSILFSPIIIVIVLVLFFKYKKQIIYIHKRIGKDGESFNLYKFRTMYVNSETILKQYLESSNAAREEWGENQKLFNDPRITSFGKILRKYSLDEIPQLINVFLGKMSIVGPRPIVSSEIEKYKQKFQIYCKVRPGITGLWQVSGRNDIDYNKRVELDIFYVYNLNLLMDLNILIKTLPVIVFKKGAY